MQDTPANLSLASLQHHGSNLLGNIRYFGNSNFTLESNSEYVYFNSAGGGLAYYPEHWSFPLAVVTALLFLAYLVFLLRTDRLNIGSYLGSLFLFLGVLFTGAAVTYFSWQAIKQFNPEYDWLYHGEVYVQSWYLWGFLFLMLGLYASIYSWVKQKWLSIEQLLAGSLTIWMLLSLVTAWYLPTASYIFTWPVLMALVGWIVLGENITKASWQSSGLLAISLFPVLFLIPPYIYLVQVMLTTEMMAVSMLLMLLILGLAWPIIWRITRNQTQFWNSAFVTAALACFLIASASSGFDFKHKKQNDISYIQNLNTKQAYWVSRDHMTDNWTQQFLNKSPQKGSPPNIRIFRNRQYLYQAAKYQNIADPIFKLTADSSSDSLRFMSIQVSTQTNAIAMRMGWDGQPTLRQIQVGGKTVLNNSEGNISGSGISFFKDLSEPLTLRFKLSKSGKVPTLYFTFLKMGLPTHLLENYNPRAPNMMPTAHWNSNTTLWQAAVNPDTLQKN